MNDEIKEILDNFEKYEARYKLHNETQFIITHREIESLLDYITNLQQENERLKEQINQYEEPDDMTLFYMWLDAKAKDKMKQFENQIIMLKQENERLKEWKKDLLNENIELENIRKEAIEFIKEKISSTRGVINDYMYHKEHNKHLIELLNEDIEMYKNELNILQNGGDD